MLSVKLAISAELVVIFPLASVNISLQTSSHTSSDTYKAQNVVVNLLCGLLRNPQIEDLGNGISGTLRSSSERVIMSHFFFKFRGFDRDPEGSRSAPGI